MRPFLWCLVAAVLFGASTPAAKLLVNTFGPILLSGVLYAGAALAVLPFAVRDRGQQVTDSSKSRWRLAGAVIFGGIVGPVLLMKGLQIAPASAVSLWLTLETVATALLARLMFREHLGMSGVVAVALVVGASAVLVGHLHLSYAIVLVALACLAWGLDNNLTSLIDGYTPAQITLVKGITAGLVLIPIGLQSTVEINAIQLAIVLGIGALGYGLSLVFYVAGAQQLGATRSQLIFSSAPVFGLGVAWLVLGESLGWSHGLAAVMMAMALRLLYTEHHEHAHHHDARVHTHWHRHDDEHHHHGHGEETDSSKWHQHRHRHSARSHTHPHSPDLHHRHDHLKHD